MSAKPDPARRVRGTTRSARASALLFGLALLAWGIGPLVAYRLASGTAPPLEMIIVTSITLLVGAAFIVLGLLMGRGATWAFWGSALLSTLLLAGTLWMTLSGHAASTAVFPALLAVSTAATSWLAIEARRRPA